MPEPKRCHSCGESTGPSAKFCESCGAEQLEQATESSSIPAVRYCQACGAGLSATIKFDGRVRCSECGVPVEAKALAEPASTATETDTRRPQPSPALPPMTSEEPAQSWYTQTWAAVVALFLFFPLGLFLMWRYQRWGLWVKNVITVAGLLLTTLIIIGAAAGGDDNGGDGQPVATETADGAAEDVPATPTVAESSDFTAEEAAYAAEVLAINADLVSVLDNVTALILEAAENPSVLFSDAWYRDLDREQARLNEAQSTLLSLEPPGSLTETHGLLVQALSEMVVALDLLESGGRDFDPNQIDEAVEHMTESTRLIQLATAAIPGIE